MLKQFDWAPMLLNVLFALRTSQHSSTGFTPFCMLYNYDPMLLFEYADKFNNGIISDDNLDCDGKASMNSDCECSATTDLLLSKIQYLEDQHKCIFDQVSKSIQKVQKHQAKGYNNRQTKGKPFEIRDKCLKCNKKDDQYKSKLLFRNIYHDWEMWSHCILT